MTKQVEENKTNQLVVVVDKIEVNGCVVPESALLEAEQVIHEWERGNSYRAINEVVKIYRIISVSLGPKAER